MSGFKRQFVRDVQLWMGKLGLKDWQIDVLFEPLDVTARCTYDSANRCGAIRLDTVKGPKLTRAEIKRLALHECLHLLMADLYDAASDRFATAREIDTAEHRVVRTLETLLIGT